MEPQPGVKRIVLRSYLDVSPHQHLI